MSRAVTSFLLAAVFLVIGLDMAKAIEITQVRGKFECPDLNNQQECAIRFERIFLAAHPGLVSRKNGRITIGLWSGRFFTIPDKEESLNVVELGGNGRFVVIRDQQYEGNTWRVLDLKTGKLTEIFGYPLFSPDRGKFVAASQDLEADYSVTIFDIYRVTPRGIVRAFRGIPVSETDWAPRNVAWSGNDTIRFYRTSVDGTRYREIPELVVFGRGVWKIVRPRTAKEIFRD